MFDDKFSTGTAANTEAVHILKDDLTKSQPVAARRSISTYYDILDKSLLPTLLQQFGNGSVPFLHIQDELAKC